MYFKSSDWFSGKKKFDWMDFDCLLVIRQFWFVEMGVEYPINSIFCINDLSIEV